MHDPQQEEQRRRFEAAVFRAQLAEAFRRPARATWFVVGALIVVGILQESASKWLGDQGVERLLLAGALIPDRVLDGDWWRPLSGTLLHKGWPHLLLNVVGLVLIGRHVEIAYGAAGFLVLWCSASLAGAGGTILAGHELSVGASGGVFGLVGAFLAIGLRLWPRLASGFRVSLVILPIVILITILGLGGLADDLDAGRVDGEAHLGGVLGGLLGGLLLPLRLRDAAGHALARPPSRRSRVTIVVVAVVAVASFSFAVLALARRAGTLPEIEPPVLRRVDTAVGTLRLPVSPRYGLWQGDRCQGEAVSADWAVAHGHTLCVELPLGGMLLLGRRERLLTMDRGDRFAMWRAIDERRFVHRQHGVLLHPVGAEALYVVLGPDLLMPGFAAALAPMLPVEATVTRVSAEEEAE
ncbi:MAG: rhomboid family intramembrane serine protease [Deltaproteobacteria bacterium]|nr:rhomboid family intramembrane serine protease [Deltaproteobacteria bacterium]